MGSSFESFERLDSFLESFGGLDSSLESLKDVHLRKLFLGFVRGLNGLTFFLGFLDQLEKLLSPTK